jgi:hypothetical protein
LEIAEREREQMVGDKSQVSSTARFCRMPRATIPREDGELEALQAITMLISKLKPDAAQSKRLIYSMRLLEIIAVKTKHHVEGRGRVYGE